jgi:hypothetical protein
MRFLVVTAAVFAAGAIWAPTAQAAPVFDEYGYSTCTATTLPGPDQDFDAVVTNCCVSHGGLTVPTNYGLGCVKQVDDPSPDYRPTIVMPMHADPNLPDESSLEELEKLPPLPPPP